MGTEEEWRGREEEKEAKSGRGEEDGRRGVSGHESVDLLLKRPSGNNGRRATRATDTVCKRGREIPAAKDHYFIPA